MTKVGRRQARSANKLLNGAAGFFLKVWNKAHLHSARAHPLVVTILTLLYRVCHNSGRRLAGETAALAHATAHWPGNIKIIALEDFLLH